MKDVFAENRCPWATFALWLTVAVTASHGWAASGTWTETSGDGAWSVAGKWSGGIVANGADFIADFGALNIPVDSTVRLDSSRTIGHLHFGDVIPDSNWVLNNDGNNGNTLTLAVSSGVPSITVSNQTATISARLVGPQGIQKLGAGYLRLRGNNSYDGGTFLRAGTLGVDSDDNLGGPNSNLLINGGTLRMIDGTTTFSSSRPVILEGVGGSIDTNGSVTTLGGGLGGAGSLTKIGLGTLRLTSFNNYSGGTNINEGTLIFSPNTVPASGAISVSSGAKVGLESVGANNFSFGTFGNLISLDNSTLEFRSDLGGGGQGFSQSVWFGNVTLAGDSWIQTNAGPYTVGRVDGTISGSGSLFVSGFVRLNNANSFTGQTRITGGEVLLTNSNALAGSTLHLHASDTGNVRFEGITSATVGSLVGTRDLLLQNDVGQPLALTIGTNGSNNTYTGRFTGSGSLIKAGGGIHTLRGQSDHFGGTTISAGALNVDSDLALGRSTARLTFGGGTLQLGADIASSRPVTVSSAGGVIDTNGFNATYSGGIEGPGAFTKTGAGSLILSGGNIYTGPTYVSQGTLQVGAGGNTGYLGDTSVSIASGATLAFNRNDTATFNGSISGAGQVVKDGAGFLNLYGINTHSGGTRINGGSIFFAQDSNFGTGALTFNGGAIYATSAVIPDNIMVSRPLILETNGGVINSNQHNLTLSGSIQGSGQLTKAGSGSLHLTGNNNSTGGTVLNQGLLYVSSQSVGSGPLTLNGGMLLTSLTSAGGNPFSSNSEVVINPGGGLIDTNGNNATLSGIVNGAGALQKTGFGELVLTNGNNTYSGGNVVSLHYLRGNSASIKGPIDFTDNEFSKGVYFDQNTDGDFNNNITGDGWVTKNGAGNLALWGYNNYQNGTYINAGTITGDSASFGTGAINIVSGAMLRFQQNVSGTFSATIDGGGTLEKTGAGTLSLTSASTYAGGTTINGGKLAVNSSIIGTVTLNSGGTLGGTGTISGNVSGSGRVAPGNSPGILTIDGDYTQNANSTLEIEVASYSGTMGMPDWIPGTDHDQLQVTGTAALAGRLEVPVIDPLKSAGGPALGLPPIEFLTAGSVVGEFSAVVAPGLEQINPNLAVDVEYITSGPNQGARLSFVPKKTNVVFDDATNTTADWFDNVTTWEDTDNPGNPVLPSLVNDISIENLTATAQTVELETANAFVAKLSVGGGTDDLMITVGDGTFSPTSGNLSSTLDVTVETNGIIAMNGGTLATSEVMVDGGTIKGNGLVDLSSTGTLSVVDGTISPGFSVGQLEIDGDLELSENAQLLIDVESTADTLDITGQADLGGTIVVDASQISGVTPGMTLSVLTADAGLGGTRFDDIETIGADDIFFVPVYSADEVALFVTEPGDLDQLGGVDEDDVDDFAMALSNPDLYDDMHDEDSDVAGDLDGDNDCDVDDIDNFAERLNMSLAELILRMQDVANVPEPNTLALMVITLSVVLPLRESRRPSR